jgi:hypothetical protein
MLLLSLWEGCYSRGMVADFVAPDRSIFAGWKGLDIQFYKGLLRLPVTYAICSLLFGGQKTATAKHGDQR